MNKKDSQSYKDSIQKEINKIKKAYRKIRELEEKERQASLSSIYSDDLAKYRAESKYITEHMDDWAKVIKEKNSRPPGTLSAPHLSVLFLGACAGDWAARSLYRGALPGMGGFLLIANGKRILVDPGAYTFQSLNKLKQFPVILDQLVVTHSHWDCIRDLQLIIMAACPTSMERGHSENNRLKLLAHSSVLYGVARPEKKEDIDNIINQAILNEDIDKEERDKFKETLNRYKCIYPGALNIFDLEIRLKGQYDELSIGKEYKIGDGIYLYARRAKHNVVFGCIPEEGIPSLDIVIYDPNDMTKKIRCVYLSDSEYDAGLAKQYIDEKLGKIDLLICNVKTLDVLSEEDPKGVKYTRKHLGWEGLLQLTKDFKKEEAFSKEACVVLRSWGIETVTVLGEDKVLVAKPEKLRTLEKEYNKELQKGEQDSTKLKAIIPDLTQIDISYPEDHKNSSSDRIDIKISHHRQPFGLKSGCMREFEGVFYCNDNMEQKIQIAKAATRFREKNILILGETGTGKDELARAIHKWAVKKEEREDSLKITSAPTLPGQIAWDQLVGHKKGAFTGAIESTNGIFKKAGKGTIVIQEIGDMPLEHQAQMLQVLQERTYSKIGEYGKKPLDLEAQIIATTDRDLGKAIREGQFRQQLLQRFDVVLRIPPLRERRDDIPAIIEGLLRKKEQEQMVLPGNKIIKLLQEERYTWPGNVRQLIRVLTISGELNNWTEKSVRDIADAQEMWSLECSPIDNNKIMPDKFALDEFDDTIFKCLEKHGPLSMKRIEELLGKKWKLTFPALRARVGKLNKKNVIQKIGRGRNTKYCIHGDATKRILS